MAQVNYVLSLLGGLEADLKRTFRAVFAHILSELRFGSQGANEASENFAAHYYEARTPSTANDEFTVAHQFGRAPYLVIPMLPVGSSGFQSVPLVVARPADASYLYFRSSSTGATVRLYVEA